MFEIRLLSKEEQGQSEDHRGSITIGDFSEEFICAISLPERELELAWKNELRKLVGGAESVALVYDPRFAWIIYKEGSECFVQEVLSVSGDFTSHLASRITYTDDGQKVSEWSVPLEEISRFTGA